MKKNYLFILFVFVFYVVFSLNDTYTYSKYTDNSFLNNASSLNVNDVTLTALNGNIEVIDFFTWPQNNIHLHKDLKFTTLASSEHYNTPFNKAKTFVIKKTLFINADAYIKSVSIYNVLGQNVINMSVENSNSAKINMQSEKKGIYIVKINFDNSTITKKIVLD